MDRHERALRKLAEGAVIPATPLALREDRGFNEEGQRLLMRYYLNCGVGGIATAVHTTQFDIRRQKSALFEPVLRVVSEEAGKFEQEKNTVIIKIAGACGDKEQAVEEAKLAKRYGYDAVLLSPGGLRHLKEQDLVERTKAVAAEMPVIGFYLQTAVGGRTFSYDYWERICAIENVAAIKCASFSRYTTLEVVRAAAMSDRREEIALYTGNDDNIIVDLLTKYRFKKDGKTVEKSFAGGLLGHWSVWTKRAVDIFERIRAVKEANAGEQIPAELLTLAAEVTDANSAFFDAAHGFAGCIPGLHEVLRRQGLMENGYCLNPKEALSKGQMEEIDRVYAAYPHLNDDGFIKENIALWRE